MDILTLSLAVKKALAAMGLKIEPSKKLFSIKTQDGHGVADEAHALVVGHTYNVNIGNLYEDNHVCKSTELGNYIGNLHLTMPEKEDTGEPFFVGTFTIEEGTVTFAICSVDMEITVSTLETIHPIDPKYLPGVCLPVVELSTVLTPGYTELTEAESSDLTKATEQNLPCVIKCVVVQNEVETYFTSLFMLGGIGNIRYLQFNAGDGGIQLGSDGTMWTANVIGM